MKKITKAQREKKEITDFINKSGIPSFVHLSFKIELEKKSKMILNFVNMKGRKPMSSINFISMVLFRLAKKVVRLTDEVEKLEEEKEELDYELIEEREQVKDLKEKLKKRNGE